MIKRLLSCWIVLAFLVSPRAVFAIPSADYLREVAIHYYDQGYYQEALHEFSKVLLIEPDDVIALRFVKELRAGQGRSRADVVASTLDEAENVLRSVEEGSRAQSVAAQKEVEKKRSSYDIPGKPAPSGSARRSADRERSVDDDMSVTGVVQVAAGVRGSGGEFIWNEANGDLNEKNYRILYSETKHNTYDPAIYDRVRVDINTNHLEEIGLDKFSAHANITVDPWSFTGKSETFTVTGDGGDQAEFELKYWSNTGRTVNEIVNTLTNGDAVALPEITVKDGVTTATTATSTFLNTFAIPSKKITYEFLPLREFWVDYQDESLKLRAFPIAYQDQALTTDDPLGLSNRHTWWEESPWLAEWKPGILNTGASPNDFAKGKWDDSMAFFTRDSDGVRLTGLRGASMAYDGIDMKVRATIASPKTLWQDYGDFKTYATAERVTLDAAHNLGFGFTHTSHLGYNEDILDGLNNVVGVDAKMAPAVGHKITGEIAYSDAYLDRSNDVFVSHKRGNAYIISWIGRFPNDDVYDKDYFAIQKSPEEDGFLKVRFQAARMEDGFDPSLATYRQTRDDEFWSRHVSFRKHPLYLYTGLNKPMSFDDIKIFGIGDGIDTGRDVLGLRAEGKSKILEREVDALADVRNIHNANTGAFMENTSRLEVAVPLTDKLRSKFLGIRQSMCDTTAGYDPFMFDPYLNEYYVNTAIAGGKDPSIATLSGGAEYDLNEWISVNGVWEHTNDANVATDNYPRGLFNSSSFTTLMEDGKVYRVPIPFLYSQSGFDLPPYSYFDIFKFGCSIRPLKELEFYLDFAYNENKKAGQIDDNMNHFGLEVAYTPDPKWSLLFKYSLSRWIDMLALNATGAEVYNWHSNIFIESRYHLDESSEFICAFGVGGITPLGTATYDPFGGALAVLDTQKIIRVYYRRSF